MQENKAVTGNKSNPQSGLPLAILVTACFSALVASNLTDILWNADLFDHLGVGIWMLREQTLPTANLWTTSGFGSPWMNGAWLFDGVVGFVFQHFHFWGLVLLKFISLAASLFAIGWVFAAQARSVVIGFFIASLVCLGSFFSSMLNPMVWNLSLLVLSFYFVQLYRVKSSYCNLPLAGFILVNALLANSSDLSFSSFIIQLLFLVCLLVSDPRTRSRMALLLLALIVAQCISPYGGQQIFFSIAHETESLFQALISADAAATIYDYGFAVLLLLLGCCGAVAIRTRFPMPELLVIIFTVLIALADKHYLPLALAVTGICFTRYWGQYIRGVYFIPGLVEGLRRLESRVLRLRPMATGGSWLFLCIAFVSIYPLRATPVAIPVFPSDSQIDLIGKSNNKRLLNDLEVGSYLVYKGVLKADSRDAAHYPFMSSRFPSHGRLLGLDLDALAGPWQPLLQDTSFGSVLTRQGTALAGVLQSNEDWLQIIEDPQSETSRWMLFVRKENADHEL